MTQENSRMTGFHHFDNLKFQGFNETNISQLERILENIKTDPRYIKFTEFFSDVRSHVADVNAHHLDLTPFQDEIVNELYTACREQGYTGNKTSLLLIIKKPIEIGTDQDYVYAVNQKKAVNVTHWKTWSNQHENALLVHPHIRQALTPDVAMRTPPLFHLDALFPENYTEGGCDFKAWNIKEGTIFIKLRWDEKLYTEPLSEKTFLTIEGNPHKLSFKLIHRQDEGVVIEIYLDKIKLISFNNTVTQTGNMDKLVVTYSPYEIYFRDLATIYHTGNVLKGKFNKFILGMPLGNSTESISKLTYYPTAASAEEQLFFLN